MTFADLVYCLWALGVAVGLALWGLSHRPGRNVGRIASPSVLLVRLLRPPWARGAAVLVWVWLGIHFFAR